MKKNIAAILILSSAILGTTVASAAGELEVNRFAKSVAGAKLTSKAWPVGYKVSTVDARKDPWVPVNAQQMAATVGEKRPFQVTATVDYNGDGIKDIAYIANNSKQGAVIVQLGGGKGVTIAFKADEKLLGGQEIAAAGNRRLVMLFPESSVVIMTSERGKPENYYIGE